MLAQLVSLVLTDELCRNKNMMQPFPLFTRWKTEMLNSKVEIDEVSKSKNYKINFHRSRLRSSLQSQCLQREKCCSFIWSLVVRIQKAWKECTDAKAVQNQKTFHDFNHWCMTRIVKPSLSLFLTSITYPGLILQSQQSWGEGRSYTLNKLKSLSHTAAFHGHNIDELTECKMCPFNQSHPSSIAPTTISHWIMSTCLGIFDLCSRFDLRCKYTEATLVVFL